LGYGLKKEQSSVGQLYEKLKNQNQGTNGFHERTNKEQAFT
jgi:hypothetical protein